MKNSLKVLIAAGTLAASLPVALAQDAPPPPPPPPPPAMAPGGGGGGGRGGFGGGGAGGFQAPATLPPADLATINKVLKDLIGKADPDAKKILDANPTWDPITQFGGGRGGAGGGGRRGGAGGAGGGGGRRGGGGGGAGGGGAAGA